MILINHEYNIYERIGDRFFRNPTYMTFYEYTREEFDRSTQEYWKQKSDQENLSKRKGNRFLRSTSGEKHLTEFLAVILFDIRPQGSAELIFGLANSTK